MLAHRPGDPGADNRRGDDRMRHRPLQIVLQGVERLIPRQYAAGGRRERPHRQRDGEHAEGVAQPRRPPSQRTLAPLELPHLQNLPLALNLTPPRRPIPGKTAARSTRRNQSARRPRRAPWRASARRAISLRLHSSKLIAVTTAISGPASKKTASGFMV